MTTYVYLVGRTTTDGGCHDCYPDRVFSSSEDAMGYGDMHDRSPYPDWIYMEDGDAWIKLDAGYNAAHVKQGWWEGWYVRKENISILRT